MFDLNLELLADFALVFLIPGIVETAKKFGLKGNACLVVSLLLGFVFVGLAEALNQGMIPAGIIPYLRVVVMGIGGALAASGYYDLFKKWFAKP